MSNNRHSDIKIAIDYKNVIKAWIWDKIARPDLHAIAEFLKKHPDNQLFAIEFKNGCNISNKRIHTTKSWNKDKLPVVLAHTNWIEGQPNSDPGARERKYIYRKFWALLGSGSTNSLIHTRCLSLLTIIPFSWEHKHIATTASGSFDTLRRVLLHNLRMPEFTNHHCIVSTKAHVFDAPRSMINTLQRISLTVDPFVLQQEQ